MDYALPALATLKACPFCREMFSEDEAKECPLCGVALTSFHKLAPSSDSVDADDGLDAVEPQDRELPWTHFGNGRGPLLVCCLLGLVAFALPWVYMHAPDEIALAGHDMAKRSPPVWAAFVSWFTLLPMVLSRRTRRSMRGIRYASAFLASLPAVIATILLLNPPQSAHVRGITVHLRFTWGYGLFAALAVSVVGTVIAAFFFGGKRADEKASDRVAALSVNAASASAASIAAARPTRARSETIHDPHERKVESR